VFIPVERKGNTPFVALFPYYIIHSAEDLCDHFTNTTE